MVEFKADNGKFGAKRVARTATGYKGTIQFISPEGGIVQGSVLSINRGVGDDGDPYIEIDITNLDERSKALCAQILLRAFAGKGLRAEKVNSPHGQANLAVHVRHNELEDVFSGLLGAEMQDGMPIVPQGFADFVSEQEKVRNGLEQSLMFAFGSDCHLKPKGKVPKNEANRIQRLASYFRNGVPEIKEKFKGQTSPQKI